MSKSKLPFYKQIPNSSMHILKALSSFSVPMKGQPEQVPRTLTVARFAVRAPSAFWHLLYVYVISSKWTIVDFVSPSGGGGVCDHGQPAGARAQGRSRAESGAGVGRPAFSNSPGAALSQASLLAGWETKVGDRWLSMLLYLAVYNSRLFLLWWSFLT